MPDKDEFEFEVDGIKYVGWVGKTHLKMDDNGVVRIVSGVWQEVGSEGEEGR